MQTPDDNPDITRLWILLHSGTGSATPVPEPISSTSRAILDYLQELPEPIGRVIRLRYVEHQTIPAIALSLHCSKRMVRNFLDKGLHRLRKRFIPAYQDRLNTIKNAVR
jgi:DNA-directed RNA polymerase specialized sigma24 family protein